MIEELAKKVSHKYPFGVDDFFQQVIGSVILTAPFLFTEEVWTLASNMSVIQGLVMAGFSLAIGHGVLYVAHQERDWNSERKLFGVTFRYLSLMAVAFGTILVLIIVTGAHSTFNSGIIETVKAIALMSPFSVVGAATADSLI